MKILLFLLAFCVFADFSAAEAVIPGKIRSYVNKIPRSDENNLDTLVAYLTKPYNNDYDKASAIAYWIASRINYDQYMYNKGKPTELLKQKRIAEEKNLEDVQTQPDGDILSTRVGICSDYANLFNRMAQTAGIQAGSVSGYISRNPKKPEVDNTENNRHVWNYFMHNGEKVYVDTTFMATAGLGYTPRITEKRRQESIEKWKKANAKKSVVKNVRDFYFDFKYEKERGKIHVEDQN